MSDFSFEVDLNLEALAAAIGRSSGIALGPSYQDVMQFIIDIDGWIGDLDFTKGLYDELGEIIAREM